jgi:hypothetical protein
MGWFRKVIELEATLYVVPRGWLFNFPKGEVEYEVFEDGEKKLEVKLFGVKVPQGALVALATNSGTVCEIALQGGRGYARLTSQEGDPIPNLEAGNELEIYYQGRVILSGKLRQDD